MNCSEEQRFQAMLRLYDHTHGEITRYRDYEWKLTSWTLVLFGGIVAATTAVPIQRPAHRVCIYTLLAVITCVIAGYAAWHIWFVHRKLRWNRELRRRMEVFFSFYDETLSDAQTILPVERKGEVPRFFDYVPHLITYWALIALGAIYAITTIIYAAGS